MSKVWVPLMFVLLLLGVSLSFPTPVTPNDAQTRTPDYWPTNGWQTSPPELCGMNPTLLEAMYDFIEEGNFPLHSLLVIRNGYLVFEHYPVAFYDADTVHIIYSCTKSVTSALVGIALQHGYLSNVNERIVDLFADWTIDNLGLRKQAMTVEHLLTMTSGFQWDDDYNYFGMTASGNWVQYVLDLPMVADPGTQWVYNTGASHLLSAIVNFSSYTDTAMFAEMNLFNPLGITNYVWLTDNHGIPNGGSSLHLTPRDMAKIGFLYLQSGNWAGEEVLSSAWVTTSTSPRIALYGDEGYGYQWWTNGLLGSFEARGYAGQRIVVIPDHDLVLVFTANDIALQVPVATLIYDYILPAIQEPLFSPNVPPTLILLVGLLVGFPVVVVAVLFIRARRLDSSH